MRRRLTPLALAAGLATGVLVATPITTTATGGVPTTTVEELAGQTYVPSDVRRVVDSREAAGDPILSGKLTPGQPAEIDVADLGDDIPAPGETAAYVFNVVATEGEGPGFVSLFPCAAGFNGTANVNFAAETATSRSSAAVLVVASPDDAGKICVQSNRAVHIVADFFGSFPTGQGFVENEPFRLLDGRDGSGAAGLPAGRLTPGVELRVPVAGVGDLPANGMSSVVLGLVGTGAVRAGWLAAYSCADGYDGSSTLNYLTNRSRANLAVVSVDPDGDICLRSNQPVFVVADVLGHFVDGSDLQTPGVERVADSRNGTGGLTGKLQPGVEAEVDLTTLALPEDTTSLILNLASTGSEAPGWLALYPCTDGRNGTSNLNYQTGVSTANATIVPLPSDGRLCVQANQATHAVIDIVGAFGPPAPVTVNLLHVNDHHSHLQPDGGFGSDLGIGLGDVEYSLGGFPAVVAKIDQLEAQLDNTIKVHAGDAITGTLFYTLFQGEADAALMNEVCFDMFALGNHEFDDGDEQLANGFLTDLADPDDDCRDTPVIAANVVPEVGTPLAPTNPDDFIKPYVIEKIDGQRVGFIGINIAQKTQVSSQPLPTTQFLDEVETAQKYVDELAGMGIDNVVLVTHQGYQNDIALAAQVSGVDAIIGGDSHSLLGDFGALGFTTEGPYPTQVTNLDGDPVCVAQAWQYSYVVGQLELTMENGTTTSCGGNPHLLINDDFVKQVDDPASDDPGRTIDAPLTAQELADVLALIDSIPSASVVEPDPGAQALLDTFADQVDELSQEQVATAGEALCLNRLPGDNRSAGTPGCAPDVTAASGAKADVNGGFIQQIVTDAFLARAFRADLAIQNAGGVRIPLEAGPITVGDVYTLLPFSNTLVELTLTGQEIDDVLEQAIENFVDDGGSTGSYPYGSAIRYDVDLTQPFGDRIQNVEVKDRDSGIWAPLDLTKTDYVVVTNSFLASGRDGYDAFGVAFADGRVVDTFIDYAQGFFDYLEEDLAGGTLTVPPPEEFSTQSFVPLPPP
ncbi:MAG TPA: 5'-nucleotidase C-terminal domain-containing protein [Ilumatobacteraceae bacterium]|nr:5'-nucleotidase C-terminal domain-containing protein [Ilumatobacteraceae bacterium]